MVFVGVDIGTSSVKAAAFDEKGQELARSAEALTPKVLPSGLRETDSRMLWECAKKALRRLADTDGLGQRIDSITVSSFGEAFVAIDERGDELCPVMIFTDRRGEEDYFEAMKNSSDLRVAQICGLPPSITYSISKLLYIKNHQSSIYESTKKFLFVTSYVLFRLSGEMAVDYSLAGRSMLFDIHTNKWSDELVDAFGMDLAKLPNAYRAGKVLGKLLPDVANELNIRQDALLVLGGHDQPVCAAAVGLDRGRVVNSLGTAQCVTPVMDAPLSAEATLDKYFPSQPFVVDGKFNALGYNASSGMLIDWFYKTFAAGGKKDFAQFEANAPKKPTALFTLPYLAGSGTPFMDHRAGFCLTGAEPGTTRYDIYKACLEGLALDMRLNVSALMSQGVELSEMVAVGGGSKSAMWLQIIADILGVKVSTLECGEACALGGAVLAAAALGAYASTKQAAAAMSRTNATFLPNGEFASYYDEKYDHYTRLYAAMKPFNDFSNRL